MKTINWGILGAGAISKQFAAAVSKIQGTKIKAVAAREIIRAKEFADLFGVEKSYGSYEELAKDAEVDIVYIGTTHNFHKEHSLLCINEGKSVLCEKPFTINLKEALEVIRLAKEKKVFLMEAVWTKFLPITHQVVKWIDEEKIGDIQEININFGFLGKKDPQGRLFNRNLAGGALLDIGIYPIMYATLLMNSMHITDIKSEAVIGNTGVDEENTIILKFKNNVTAHLQSAITKDIGSDAQIIGTKGKIIVPRFFMAQTASILNNSDILIEKVDNPFSINGYEYEIQEVLNCIRGEKLESNIHSLKDTENLILLMDKIRNQWGFKYPIEE